MKYKQLYEQEKIARRSDASKIRDLDYQLEKLQLENARLDEYRRIVEGRESFLKSENGWLKTTLRLVVLSHEKTQLIIPELEMDGTAFRRKL